MANRRLVGVSVYEWEKFIQLSDAAKALYPYLMIKTDDDGFLDNMPSKLRTVCAQTETLDELVRDGFILDFHTGVYAVAHFYMLNRLPPSTRHQTVHLSELEQLVTVDKEYEVPNRKTKELYNRWLIEPADDESGYPVWRFIQRDTDDALVNHQRDTDDALVNHQRDTDDALSKPNLSKPNLTKPIKTKSSTSSRKAKSASSFSQPTTMNLISPKTCRDCGSTNLEHIPSIGTSECRDCNNGVALDWIPA